MLGPLAFLLLLLPLRGDCRLCSDTGRAPCPKAGAHDCPPGSALQCSFAIDCESCGGLGTLQCARCGRPEPAGDAERRMRDQAWRAETRAAETLVGRPLAHAANGHFRLTWDVARLDVKEGSTLHGGLHLYLDRLEALHQRVRTDLGAAEEDFLAPTEVYVWTGRADQEKASLVFTRQSSSTESKLMGARPAVSLFYDKAWLHEEFELHQALVHQVTHCLLSNVWDGVWPGNIHGGWLDEGLAHSYEIELFERARHYCFVESDTIRDLAPGGWEPAVRLAVERDEAPGFLGVSAKNTHDLTSEERLFAWSYVDFLRRTWPEKLGPLARAVKARRPLNEAIPEVLGFGAFEFEPRWKDFVRTTYAKKEKRGKRRR